MKNIKNVRKVLVFQMFMYSYDKNKITYKINKSNRLS